MTEFSKSYYKGFYGNLSDYPDSSTLVRMQQQYWATKQAVFKKLGKKEDDCITASDAELDTKLELFQTIEESCLTLMRVLENYQDRLCVLAQEENATGRFLKESGKRDKTRAGKMMSATGKTLSYSAQQRLALRMPLIRLYQEVETFQYRAITDTLQTVEKMEKSRTSYRGALMWMKDVSQQLDPDTHKQLEKFRKVQSHVRKSKMRFDKLKLDTLQKIDLLSASRCNMFSHALATYQNVLLHFWKKTAQTMTSVAQSFKGYQHFEFSMLKELTEPSKKLAEETSSSDKLIPAEDDKDAMLFFEAEYHDEEEGGKEKIKKKENKDCTPILIGSSNCRNTNGEKGSKLKTNKELQETDQSRKQIPLLNLDDSNIEQLENITDPLSVKNENACMNLCMEKNIWTKDLLTESAMIDSLEKDELTLLSEILNAPCESFPLMPDFYDSFASQWEATFGNVQQSPEKIVKISESELLSETGVGNLSDTATANFLPSQLLDMNPDITMLHLAFEEPPTFPDASKHLPSPVSSAENAKLLPGNGKSKQGKHDMSAWFNLFADLDPLANPDLIGQKREDFDDRNC